VCVCVCDGVNVYLSDESFITRCVSWHIIRRRHTVEKRLSQTGPNSSVARQCRMGIIIRYTERRPSRNAIHRSLLILNVRRCVVSSSRRCGAATVAITAITAASAAAAAGAAATASWWYSVDVRFCIICWVKCICQPFRHRLQYSIESRTNECMPEGNDKTLSARRAVYYKYTPVSIIYTYAPNERLSWCKLARPHVAVRWAKLQ